VVEDVKHAMGFGKAEGAQLAPPQPGAAAES
jgi:hypothetical protein